MNQNNMAQTRAKSKTVESLKDWLHGYFYETTIRGLIEPIYEYDIEDIQRLLSVLARDYRHPKILYIEYDYGDVDVHFVKLVDPEFKAFLEKKGVKLQADEVDGIDEDYVKEFLEMKEGAILYFVNIEDDDDTATVVAYVV